MKKTLTIISIILATITVALLTSWLLSWRWVADHWVRQSIIIIFMLVQLVFGVMLTINYIKTNLKNKV